MSFCDTYKQRKRSHTARENIDTLTHMGDYFQDEANWTQDMYQRQRAMPGRRGGSSAGVVA
jgi:hypothetical protein